MKKIFILDAIVLIGFILSSLMGARIFYMSIFISLAVFGVYISDFHQKIGGTIAQMEYGGMKECHIGVMRRAAFYFVLTYVPLVLYFMHLTLSRQ